VIGPHALRRGDGDRVEGPSSCISWRVPTSHRVRGRQRASAAVRVVEKSPGRFLSQVLRVVALAIEAVLAIIVVGGATDVMGERRDVRAIAD
jgi:hypothetical protein